MGNHTPTIVALEDGRWVGRCTCRWRAPDICDTTQEAEDTNLKHLRDVERVRANARKSMPPLNRIRDHYQMMATDPMTDEAHRPMWQQLADEITHRLNDQGPPDTGQDPLFSV